MNKKQLIVVWVMGILVASMFGLMSFAIGDNIFPLGYIIIQALKAMSNLIVIFTIGGLFIYTFRNKKKNE